jgi:hypothetical protein
LSQNHNFYYMKKILPLLVAVLFTSLSASAQIDLAGAALSPLEYQVPGTINFSVVIENKSTTGVGTMTVYWKLDNGPVNTAAKNASNIYWSGKLGQIKDPAFQVSLPAAGTYKLKAWVRSINPIDNNTANDTVVKTIRVFETLPKKNVVLEVFKHQGCGPCYDAASYCDTFISKNPSYSVASIYCVKTDALYNADGATFNDIFNYAHPMPVFDRFRFPYKTDLGSSFYTINNDYLLRYYGDREQFYEPVQVYFHSVNWNETTRELRIKAGAIFFDDLSGDYRFNIYLTEDSIKGFQASAPDPNNYYHKHVLRAMLGGPYGKQGSLPATIKKGDNKDYEFVYTIPQSYNINKMHITALVQNYTGDDLNKRILNSEQKTFKQAVSVQDVAAKSTTENLIIYPNPAKNLLHVSLGSRSQKYDLRIVDMNGKTLITQNCTGNTEVNLQSLPAGNYILLADDGAVVHTQTIVKE